MPLVPNRLILSIILIMVCMASPAMASECEDKLEKAKQLFDTGRPELVRSTLGNCLSRLEGVKRVDAYMLLIQAELAADNYGAAEKELKNLLKYSPEFEPEKRGTSQEFLALYNTFRVAPVVSFGVFGSYNLATPTVLTDYNADGLTHSSEYNPIFSYQFGMGTDIYISPTFQLNTGIAYRFDNFTYERNLLDFSSLRLQHSHTSLIVPLTLKYLVNKKRYGFFVHGGIAFKRLLSLELDQFETTSSQVSDINIDGPKLEITNLVHQNSLQAVLGFGKRFKIPTGYISADLAYSLSFENMTQKQKRYSEAALAYEFGYVLDDMKVDNLLLSIGYYYSIYKAKKKK